MEGIGKQSATTALNAITQVHVKQFVVLPHELPLVVAVRDEVAQGTRDEVGELRSENARLLAEIARLEAIISSCGQGHGEDAREQAPIEAEDVEVGAEPGEVGDGGMPHDEGESGIPTEPFEAVHDTVPMVQQSDVSLPEPSDASPPVQTDMKMKKVQQPSSMVGRVKARATRKTLTRGNYVEIASTTPPLKKRGMKRSANPKPLDMEIDSQSLRYVPLDVRDELAMSANIAREVEVDAMGVDVAAIAGWMLLSEEDRYLITTFVQSRTADEDFICVGPPDGCY